ncbi:MAG: nuclear transport factor 2 family protein [Candidatus Omnitrophica bacterium]|nr:nuclear transport factor 2 family protein [Candidatus Omnitrophota bacterium]
MKGFFSLIGGILVLAVTAWFLLTYVLISDEQKIQRVIEKARCSVESGSLLSLASLFTLDYRHENGMGREDVLAGLRELFQQTDDRRVRVLRSIVDVRDDRAEASVTFIFSGKAPHAHPGFEDLLSNSTSETQDVQITFQRDGRSWKIHQTAFRRSPARAGGRT